MDKWDRNCFGSWHREHNAEEVTPFTTADGKPDREAFYRYIHEQGLGLQGPTSSTAGTAWPPAWGLNGLRPTLDKYANQPFQYATWLNVDHDLYNRNPALSAWLAPGFTTSTRTTVRSRTSRACWRSSRTPPGWRRSGRRRPTRCSTPCSSRTARSGRMRWTSAPSAASRRARFHPVLRTERKYSLSALALGVVRPGGRAPAVDDATFPDQRTFYGFTPGSQMLQGEWATHGEQGPRGVAAGWAAADWNDATWRRAAPAGDQTVNFARGATWYRLRFDLAANLRAAPKLYLSVISLNHGWDKKPGVVFLNGKQIGEIRMVDWYARTRDISRFTGAVQPTGNTLPCCYRRGRCRGRCFSATSRLRPSRPATRT